MDWPTAAVIFGGLTTVSAGILKFTPARRPSNGKHECLHGNQITVLVTKFEGFEKKLDDFITENTRINNEQYDKINMTAARMVAVETALEIVKRKVLNGSP